MICICSRWVFQKLNQVSPRGMWFWRTGFGIQQKKKKKKKVLCSGSGGTELKNMCTHAFGHVCSWYMQLLMPETFQNWSMRKMLAIDFLLYFKFYFSCSCFCYFDTSLKRTCEGWNGGGGWSAGSWDKLWRAVTDSKRGLELLYPHSTNDEWSEISCDGCSLD